jgi:hypothetical protein
MKKCCNAAADRRPITELVPALLSHEAKGEEGNSIFSRGLNLV